jgi:hypothetical protein
MYAAICHVISNDGRSVNNQIQNFGSVAKQLIFRFNMLILSINEH